MAQSREPNYTAAGAAAFKLLRHFGITDPRRIVLEDLAMARGVLVLDDRLVGAEARLVRSGKRGLIRVDERIRESGRKRFAIAHELGHWLLHDDVSQLSLCTGADIHGYAGSREELEANAFAGRLLMPARFMRSNYDAAPSLRLFSKAADELDTTLTATAVRLVEVTSDPCLVVFSSLTDGRVRWWRRSSKCPTVWLERRQPIAEQSVAAEVVAGASDPSLPGEAQVVDSAAWFSHVGGHERFVVTEESMRLGSYDTLLTLLTVGE